MDFLLGPRGKISATRIESVGAACLAGLMPFLQIICKIFAIEIDLFPYFTALLAFSASVQVGGKVAERN